MMEDDEIAQSIDYLQEVMSDYERMLNNVGQNGLSASMLLYYRDEIQDTIEDLDTFEVDVSKFWQKIVLMDNSLRAKAQQFVEEVGHGNFKQYQIINDPPYERWWWYLNKSTHPPSEKKRNWQFWKK